MVGVFHQAGADHHVRPLFDNGANEVMHLVGRIGIVSVDKHKDVRFNVFKHGSHHKTLALPLLPYHNRPFRRGDICRLVR